MKMSLARLCSLLDQLQSKQFLTLHGAETQERTTLTVICMVPLLPAHAKHDG